MYSINVYNNPNSFVTKYWTTLWLKILLSNFYIKIYLRIFRKNLKWLQYGIWGHGGGDDLWENF